jgi:hypothetical protein
MTMAKTATGWPYPLGTDFVVNGDNAIKDLADALEARRCFATFTNPDVVGPAGGFAVFKDMVLVPEKSTPNATALLKYTGANDGGIVLPWAGEWETEITAGSATLLTGRSFVQSTIDTTTTRMTWGGSGEDLGSGHALAYCPAGGRAYWQIFQGVAPVTFRNINIRVAYRGPII